MIVGIVFALLCFPTSDFSHLLWTVSNIPFFKIRHRKNKFFLTQSMVQSCLVSDVSSCLSLVSISSVVYNPCFRTPVSNHVSAFSQSVFQSLSYFCSLFSSCIEFSRRRLAFSQSACGQSPSKRGAIRSTSGRVG